jgi:3-oxoacyl-[acyl-carrier-protein] synthase-1
LDLCDAVICGGSDSLCQLTLQGFSALESVSPQVCEPFAAGRDGITIGEGATLFLMQKKSDGTNAIVLAGIGESTDAHHISAPHPEGIGAEAAMRAALNDAALTASDMAYINLHGTATPTQRRNGKRCGFTRIWQHRSLQLH